MQTCQSTRTPDQTFYHHASVIRILGGIKQQKVAPNLFQLKLPVFGVAQTRGFPIDIYVSYEQPLTKSVAEKNGIQLSFPASSNLYIDLVAPENDGGVHIEECRRKWGPEGPGG